MIIVIIIITIISLPEEEMIPHDLRKSSALTTLLVMARLIERRIALQKRRIPSSPLPD